MRTSRKISVVLLMLLISAGAFAGVKFANDDPPTTVILTQPTTPTPMQRTPPFIPVQMEYHHDVASFTITFTYPLGMADVEIRNLTSGECYEFSVNSDTGNTSLPVSGTQGLYAITVTLQNGVVYYGEIEI